MGEIGKAREEWKETRFEKCIERLRHSLVSSFLQTHDVTDLDSNSAGGGGGGGRPLYSNSHIAAAAAAAKALDAV